MRRALTLALALVCSSLWADRASAAGIRVEILAGVSASGASGDATAGASPFARVNVNFPLASWMCGSYDTEWSCSPRFHMRVDLGGTPSEVVALTNPATFRSIDFAGGISQEVHPSLFVKLYCEAGASTLFGQTGDAGALRWGGCGVRLDHFGRGWLNAVFTGDQRLGGVGYRPAVAIQGSISLFQSNGKARTPKGTTVALVGTAIFGVNSEAWAPRAPTSSVSAGITVGYGR